MTRADNSRFLAQAAAQRHHITLERARHAIEGLDRDGHAITFCAVARTAGISRAWLYRQPDIRAAITRLRTTPPQHQPSPPATQRATTDSLRHRLNASRDEIADLRDQNARLRNQLALHLGQQRATNQPQHP
jgi:hypothetical protein